MKFLFKLLFLNVPLIVSYVLYHYTKDARWFLIALEAPVLYIVGMDNAISIVADSGRNVKNMFIELMEKISKENEKK